MVSTFTPNIGLEEPARGDSVGTWDVPVNNNMTLLDLVTGAQSVITLNNSPVVLSAAQFQSAQITLRSTLTGNVAITFPSSFNKLYMIRNVCTGSSAFTITLQTTTNGANVLGVPPGDEIQVVISGGFPGYCSLGRIGTYWDYAGSSVPAWVSACTVPPYLNCDGSAFNAGTYPALNVILGGNTLPDIRGTTRAALNQGTARINSSISGIDGNVRFARGGDERAQAHQHTGTTGDDAPDHTHNYTNNNNQVFQAGGSLGIGLISPAITGGANSRHQHPFTTTTVFSGNSQNMPPTTISGITMIRSA
jgi:hypothetical protein